MGHSSEAHTETASPNLFAYHAKECPSGRHAGAWDLLWAVDTSRPSGVRPVAAEEWEALPEKDRRRGNIHATVKSQGLMRWLVKLVAAPGATVLDCFAGSGSTICAAVSTGRNAIGVEQDPDYAEIARTRAEWTEKHPSKERKPKSSLARAIEVGAERVAAPDPFSGAVSWDLREPLSREIAELIASSRDGEESV